jgi:hypothetical protein
MTTLELQALFRYNEDKKAAAEKMTRDVPENKENANEENEEEDANEVPEEENAGEAALKQGSTAFLRKTYFAIVNGIPKKNSGEFGVHLEKKWDKGYEKVFVTETKAKDSKLSVTRFMLVGSSIEGNRSLVALYPTTGRTHQLRVICASVLGTPIMGDKKYGVKPEEVKLQAEGKVYTLAPLKDKQSHKTGPLYLHARNLEFIHPKTGKVIEIKASLPEHFRRMLKEMGLDPENPNQKIEQKNKAREKKQNIDQANKQQTKVESRLYAKDKRQERRGGTRVSFIKAQGNRSSNFDGERRPKFDGERKPKFEKPEGGSSDRPVSKPWSSDRQRSENNDGPRQWGSDRRREGGSNRPKQWGSDRRREGGDRPKQWNSDRKGGSDRPKQWGSDRRREGGDGPKKWGSDKRRDQRSDRPRGSEEKRGEFSAASKPRNFSKRANFFNKKQGDKKYSKK